MIEPVKLLFDECLGKPLMEDIQRLLAWDNPPPQMGHLCDYFKPGECDTVWIPKIANEGWIIITADRGKKSRIKLPKICKEWSITHVLMGPSVHHLKQNQKANIIVAVWEQLKKCSESPKGSRFYLTIRRKKPEIRLEP